MRTVSATRTLRDLCGRALIRMDPTVALSFYSVTHRNFLKTMYADFHPNYKGGGRGNPTIEKTPEQLH